MLYIANQEIPWAFACSSLLHSLLISAERVWAVRFPLTHRLHQAKRINWIFIVALWFFMFCSVLPFLFNQRTTFVRVLTASVVLTFGLVIILSYLYVIRKVISKECMVHVIKVNGLRETVSPCSPKEKKVLAASFMVVSVFIICNFPFAITNIVDNYGNIYVIVLLVINAILDPLIVLFCKKSRKSSNADSQ